MTDEKAQPTKLTMSNTKKEMIEAYNDLLKTLKERQRGELKPEKKLEEKRKKEVIQSAQSLSAENVTLGINNLKLEISKMLAQISDKLEKEVKKFGDIQKAIETKESELQEIFEIDREAATLAAIIEAQNKKRTEFEAEMTLRKEHLNREISATRTKWENEKKEQEALDKEIAADEEKRRKREKEEFNYNHRREVQLSEDKFKDDRATQEKELYQKKEQVEKELAEREKIISEKENEFKELQNKANSFSKEKEIAVTAAVKEVTAKLMEDAKNKEAIIKKESEGEKNVLTTRIASLEKTVEKQNDQIAKLSQQLELAYQKVQDIALKAVESSSNQKSMTNLQQLLENQARKSSQDK